MEIKFKKLSEKAVQPVRTENSGAGYNLVATSASTNINARGQVIITYHSSIGIDVPNGYEAVVRPASDISSRTLRMCGSPCTVSGSIDDEITADFMATTDVIPYVYSTGDVFAQLVINKKEDIDFIEIENKRSAVENSQSPLENEGKPTNSGNVDGTSGGEENIPEEA